MGCYDDKKMTLLDIGLLSKYPGGKGRQIYIASFRLVRAAKCHSVTFLHPSNRRANLGRVITQNPTAPGNAP